jgi:hypothetical protein
MGVPASTSSLHEEVPGADDLGPVDEQSAQEFFHNSESLTAVAFLNAAGKESDMGSTSSVPEEEMCGACEDSLPCSVSEPDVAGSGSSTEEVSSLLGSDLESLTRIREALVTGNL